MLVENRRGDRLLGVRAVEEDAFGGVTALTHALVVARHRGSCLLVFNRHHQHWELAGGLIEAGESARRCAARELEEESAQVCPPEALELLGVARFQLQPSRSRPVERIEHAALYLAHIDEPVAFVDNDEASAICFWDGAEDIGAVDAIDAALARGIAEPPTDASLTLTAATASDEGFARALNHAAYRAVVTAQFGAWDEADQDLRFDAKWAAASYRIVRLAGVPVGAVWLVDAADHVRVEDIQVLPSLHDRGIGTDVMRRVIAHATARGVPVELRVLTENRARSLYERLGFQVHGHTDIHHLMRRPLP